MTIINGKGLIKRLGKEAESRIILDNLSLEIEAGEFVTIMGPSGAGKSTLLYALSGMDRVDSGEVIFSDADLAGLSENDLADIRRTQMGFIFQQPTFLSNLNLMDNIVLPAFRENKKKREEIVARAKELMRSVGILELGARETSQVSGGQLQRAGICRALINEPAVIFGDEPTGALNSSASTGIMKLITEINRTGTTIVLVTHDAKVSAYADRILFLNDGRIISELRLSKYKEEAFEERVAEVNGKMAEIGI